MSEEDTGSGLRGSMATVTEPVSSERWMLSQTVELESGAYGKQQTFTKHVSLLKYIYKKKVLPLKMFTGQSCPNRKLS